MVEAHVVRDFQIGNTRIKIADNGYRGITAEGVDEILQQIATKAQRQFSAAASTENYGREENSEIPADGGMRPRERRYVRRFGLGN